MLNHLGLVLGAAPLLAIPIAQRLRGPTSFGDALHWYLLAGAFEMLVVWGWHVPLLHDAAGHDAVILVSEQASFLIAGLAVWVAIFTARTTGSTVAAALVAALTFSHMSMFGLLLALVPQLIYDRRLCQGFPGVSPLDDQHLGGALMVAGGLFYLVAAVALLLRVFEDGNRSAD